MRVNPIRYLFIFILWAVSASGQTNLWNNLLRGDYEGFNRDMVRSIVSDPLRKDSLIRLEVLNDLQDHWTNAGIVTNALNTVLASTAEPYVKYRVRERLMDQNGEFGRMKEAQALRENNGYLNKWTVVGPFTETGMSDLETVFPFEKTWNESVEYGGGQTPIVKPAPLAPFSSLSEFAPFYGKWPAYGTAYLTTSVTTTADGVHYLHLQTADPFKIWVNGKYLLQENNKGEKTTTDTFIRLDLKKGKHRIAIKMLRLSRIPRLRVAFLDANWKGVKDIEVGGGHSENTNFTFQKWEPLDRAAYRERLDGNLPQAETYFTFALMELYNGNESGFVKNIKRAIDRDRKNPVYRFYFAQYFLDNGEYPNSGRMNTALTYLKELAVQSPTPAVFDLLGKNELQNKRYREAVKLFAKAASLNPDCFLYQHHLAKTYFEQNWENEFLQAANRAVRRNPDFPETTDLLYRYYDRKDSPRGDGFRNAFQKRHPYAVDNLSLARSYLYKGEYDLAAGILDRMAEMYPNLKEIALIRAEIKVRQGRGAEGLKFAEEQLKRTPDDPQSLESMGKLELVMGQESAGLSHLKRSFQNDQGNNAFADRISLMETGHYYDLREYIDLDRDPGSLKDAFISTNATDSGAVILSDEAVLKFGWDGSWYKLVRQVIKITDKKGIERWASPSIDSYPRMKILRACTRLADGEKIDASEIKKQNGKIVISFPAVRKGVVLELVYLIPGSFANTADRTPYNTSEISIFRTKDDPIRNVVYQYVAPRGMTLNFRQMNFDPSIVVSVRTNGDQVVRKFSASDQKELKEESAMPSLVDLVPWVSVSTFPSDPSIFRRWYSGLTAPFLEVEPEHDEKLFELMDNRDLSNTGINQIRNIYLWINRNVTTAGRDIYSPQSSRRTLDTRSGSNLDKLLLMKLFLKRIGVNSDIILIRTDSMPHVDTSLVDPSLYDDAVLKVSYAGRTDHLDMENRYLAYGDMTWEKFGATGLNITTGAQERLPAPDYARGDNAIREENTVEINAEGNIQMGCRRTFQGCYSVYQEVFEDEENRELTINQMENRNIRGLNVTNIVYQPITGTNHFFGYTFQGRISSWLTGSGNERAVSLLGSKSRLFETYITDMARKNPLKIYMPVVSSQKITYHTTGWRIKSVPKDTDLRTEFGSFTAAYRIVDETTVEITMETVLPSGTVPVSKYTGFVDFCKRVGDAEKEEVVIVR